MTTVDQQKVRRTRTGLIAHDPTRAEPGYTFFAPMFGDGTVYLVDMAGTVAHTWRMPYRPGLYGYLLENGHLFYSGKVEHDLARFEAWPRFKGGAVAPPLPACPARGACRSRSGWPAGHRGRRHDLCRLSPRGHHQRRGRVGVAELGAPRPCRLSGHPAGPPGRVDAREYRRGDRRGPHRGQLPQHLDGRHDRARDREARLDARHSPPLAQQHDPRPLPNGNLLIFDNGTHRRDHPATFSRVLEIDPRTRGTVWEYTDPSRFEFFSPYISGAQRLANGNTLVCEGCHGRIFEVTRDREVVWEYVSPHFADEPGAPGLNNWVFRAFRYTSAEIAAASRT